MFIKSWESESEKQVLKTSNLERREGQVATYLHYETTQKGACNIHPIHAGKKTLKYTHLAALKNTQSANNHGDEGEVEDKQRDDKGKQINCQVADNEEEDECIDVMCRDDCAQPLDAGS